MPIEADKSAVSTINRLLRLCQASIGRWEPGIRKGCPYIAGRQIKLDRALRLSKLVCYMPLTLCTPISCLSAGGVRYKDGLGFAELFYGTSA